MNDILDPFSQNSILYAPNPEDNRDDPTFFETVGASLGYQYDPIIEYISNQVKFRDEVDPNYFPLQDMEGYEEYESDLLFAQNAEHMAELKRAIDENVERRRVLAESSFGAHFFAGLADPINLVALPFGGAGVGLGRAFIRGGAGVATLQAGQEALRMPFDPLGTPEEAAINVGSAFVAGGLLVGAVSVPMTRRAKAYKATEKALGERHLAEQPDINTSFPEPTPERPLSQVQNWEIDAKVGSGEQVIPRLKEMTADLEQAVAEAEAKFASATTPENMKLAKAELDEAQAKLDEFSESVRKQEAEFYLFKAEAEQRQATQKQIDDVDNPYGIKKNLFTDSWAFQFLTTPVKRVLQDSEATDYAKQVLVKIVSDSGLSLNLNKFGLRVGPSVYQKAAIRDGEWVQVYDRARELYKAQYGKGKTILDYDIGTNITEAGKKVGLIPQENKTFYDWVTEVNIKRMKGEKPANEAEGQFMSDLEKYYKTWETRLDQTGLLGSAQFARRELTRLEGEKAILEARIEKLERSIDAKGDLNVPNGVTRLFNTKAKLAKIESQIEETTSAVDLFSKSVRPDFAEPFNPRYWRQDIIQDRRQEFFDILHRWYTENPYTYRLDEASNTWTQVTLPKDFESVAKRVNETIDKILGIRDVTDEGTAFYGYTKSKHFRHRDVDIPNSLVVDFIETNPISIMRAYTQKIAPQYEFRVQFGKDIDDVLDDVEDSLLANGMKTSRVNRMLRDIRHVNDRVQGTVIRDPDALSLKASVVLKDLAMLNYLGSAGFATLPDFAKIMMEHELGPVFKSLFATMSDHRVKLNVEEGRIAGEIIDILKGDAHLRHVEMMRNNPLNEGFTSKVRSGFFFLNGVAPMTTIFKKMDSMVRSHTLIDYSLKLAGKHPDGKTATDFEIEYLARYNITKTQAEEIANAPWDRTDGGLFLPNSREWLTGRQVSSNYIDLGGDTLVARYGAEFNISRVVTDPDEYAQARAKWGWSDDEQGVPLGHHNYAHEGGGVAYINMDKVADLFNAMKNMTAEQMAERNKAVREQIKGMKAGPKKTEKEIALMHREFRSNNADSFKTVKDLQDFVLLHEFMHGKFKRKKNESELAYEKRINREALKRFKKEKPMREFKTSEETLETFRTALNSGIGNTVLMGTPADKPIAVDGVFYVPMHVARKVFPNVREDAKYKGYYRIENGLLGLPFQFMSYSFAAANKVTASIAQNQVRNRAVGMVAAMGLGYMGMSLKYSDWQMDNMDFGTKIARSFDASGLAAMHSDLFYTAMATSLALGGPDIGMGIIKPKYKQGKDIGDAITGVLGAGPSWAYDTSKAVGLFLSGEYGQGTGRLIRQMPYSQLFFLKDTTNEYARAFAGGRY